MPAKRDEPSAPPQAENDTQKLVEITLRVIGRLVPAVRRGMSLPYEARRLNSYICDMKNQFKSAAKRHRNAFMFSFFHNFIRLEFPHYRKGGTSHGEERSAA